MCDIRIRVNLLAQGVASLLIVVAAVISGCVPSTPSEPIPSISWQGLSEGQTVYGIVKLAVRITGDSIREVRFYLDSPGEEHLLNTAELNSGAVYAGDLFTQDNTNGSHTVYAVAAPDDGDSLQESITINVMNKSRAETIPGDVLKMTPENDKAPPQLAPAFKYVWHDPIPLEGPINTAGAEDSPFITPDGDTFYFWFNGGEMKDATEQVEDSMTGIYWSKRANSEWQEPQRLFLQYFDRIGFDGAETIRGNKLWFASTREGNYRDIDIWTAELVDGRWMRWANAGELLNKVYEVGELHVTADGSEIYFGSTKPGGKGQSDIWVTRRVNGQWLEPENIDAVNTDGIEGQPFVSEGGDELWFTRLTPGPTVWRSLKINGTWEKPELVVSNLAGEPTLDAAGNLYFVHHRWDEVLNRVTEADIYVCYRR